ncbi:MAG: tetratricopeptide repeat protein [Hyphomicrobiaceae bacterium]
MIPAATMTHLCGLPIISGFVFFVSPIASPADASVSYRTTMQIEQTHRLHSAQVQFPQIQSVQSQSVRAQKVQNKKLEPKDDDTTLEGGQLSRENGGGRDKGSNGKRPETPLEAALEGGYPTNAVKRSELRDNLYAILATSPDAESAKRIAVALERLYLTSGSATVDLLMERGLKAVKKEDFGKAVPFFTAVIEQAPDYAEAWNRRAYAYYKQNKYRLALGDLRRALALDPSHFKALDGLGTILRETGDEVGALKVFERLSEINPFWPEGKTLLQELRRKVEGRGI